MSDTLTASLRVLALEPLNKSGVIALLTVEIELAGVPVVIHGVQARDAVADGGRRAVSFHLPTYRSPTGAWRSAVELPDELRDAIADVAQQACLDAGVVVPAS